MEPPEATLDPTAVARLMDALRGGPHGTAAERAAADRILELWPNAGEQSRKAQEFHAHAAAWLHGAPAAWGRPRQLTRSTILTIAGFLPDDGEAMPHAEAAHVAPHAQFGYCDADPALAWAWEGALEGDPAASAWRAPANDPAAVLAGATAAGLEPPWSVHIQQALHWAGADEIVTTLREYRRLLTPGSSVVLSWAAIGGRPTGGLIGDAVLAATGVRTRRHTADGVEAMIMEAGLRLHPHGIRDVRRWRPDRGRIWARERLAAEAPGQFLEAIALRQ